MNYEPIQFLRQHGQTRTDTVEKKVMKILETIPDPSDQLFMTRFLTCVLQQSDDHQSNARKWAILTLLWTVAGVIEVCRILFTS